MAEETLCAARVSRATNTVANIEVVTQEWLDNQPDDPWFYWVASPDPDGDNAAIGDQYDTKKKRFYNPNSEEQ